MTIEADFVDPAGKMLARIRAQGEVRGGFFGGSSLSGVDKAVDEIAKYSVLNFKR
jgi:hypothetical protein